MKKRFFRNYNKKSFKLFRNRNKRKRSFIYLLKRAKVDEFLRYRRLFFVLQPKFIFKRAKRLVASRDIKIYNMKRLSFKFKMRRFFMSVYNIPRYLRRHWSKTKRMAHMKSTKLYGYYAKSIRSGFKFLKNTKFFKLLKLGVRFGFLRSPNLSLKVWLHWSLTWPLRFVNAGIWLKFRKLKLKRSVSLLRGIFIQNCNIYRNINYGSFSFDSFDTYFYDANYARSAVAVVEKSVSNYIHRFFMGSKFYRNYKFFLKDAGVFSNPFVDLNYFIVFNIFKTNRYSIFRIKEKAIKSSNKNLHLFRFFKGTYLGRFFFVYYINTWNAGGTQLKPIFLKPSKLGLAHVRGQTAIGLKFMSKFWFDLYSRHFIAHP